MVTVTVELDEATYERLKAEAESLGIDVGELLAADAEARIPAEEVSDEVREIIELQVRQYKDVFDRLAQ